MKFYNIKFANENFEISPFGAIFWPNEEILIVDDNKTNCEVLERRLTQNGLNCRVAFDGTSAIEEVEKKIKLKIN